MNGVPRRPMHGSPEGGMDGGYLPHHTARLPAQAYFLETSIPIRPSRASAPRLQVAQYIKKMRSKAMRPSPLVKLLYATQ